MKISTKGIYALEAMIELASRNTACVSIRDIADPRNCSVKYLAQLLISIGGKDGGYQIAKDPEEITAKDIILAVEEKLDPVVCLSHTCTRSGICRTQPVWMGMQEQIYKVLESKTLKYLTDIYRNEVSA